MELLKVKKKKKKVSSSPIPNGTSNRFFPLANNQEIIILLINKMEAQPHIYESYTSYKNPKQVELVEFINKIQKENFYRNQTQNLTK
jgi:hypothetical protein